MFYEYVKFMRSEIPQETVFPVIVLRAFPLAKSSISKVIFCSM